jgi:protein-S-isoprenylcysteine O-methyltransferase Ste14
VLLARWFRQTIRVAEDPVCTDRGVPRLTPAGPFGDSRNPAYLALAMIYAGLAVLRNSLWNILPLPLVRYLMQREVLTAASWLACNEETFLEQLYTNGLVPGEVHVLLEPPHI